MLRAGLSTLPSRGRVAPKARGEGGANSVAPVETRPPPALHKGARGRSSEVERQLPKLNVVGSIPIARSNLPQPRENPAAAGRRC